MKHDMPHTRPSLITRTLWRIETELSHAPTLAFLAAEEGVSPFHLTRALSLSVGQPVMAYVRARRLSEAAHALHHSDDTVLTIALNAGYDSHEGFARAFRAHFGVSPSEARSNIPDNIQEPITMTPKSIPDVKPRIVTFPGRRIVGRSRHYTAAERARIPAQWDATVEELGRYMHGGETYGVCHNLNSGDFDYLVGFADDGRVDADGLDHFTIPPMRFAVFEHKGHISTISETWTAIFDRWMPETKHTAAEGPEFEIYAADFDPRKPGGVAIWIPIAG